MFNQATDWNERVHRWVEQRTPMNERRDFGRGGKCKVLYPRFARLKQCLLYASSSRQSSGTGRDLERCYLGDVAGGLVEASRRCHSRILGPKMAVVR